MENEKWFQAVTDAVGISEQDSSNIVFTYDGNTVSMPKCEGMDEDETSGPIAVSLVFMMLKSIKDCEESKEYQAAAIDGEKEYNKAKQHEQTWILALTQLFGVVTFQKMWEVELQYQY